MSYSFQIKAEDKETAKAAVAAKFDEIVGQQPVHAHDRAAVLANANAVIDLLADTLDRDVCVSCNGYLSRLGVDPLDVQTASVAASASHQARA